MCAAFSIVLCKDSSLVHGTSIQKKHIDTFLQGLECKAFSASDVTAFNNKLMNRSRLKSLSSNFHHI